MKIVAVVPSIGAESSGPSYSVPGLCRGLVSAGCDVSLHFVGKIPDRHFEYPVVSHRSSRWPHPRLRRSPEMLRSLREECESADIIHNNSLWLYPNVYPAWAKKGTRCRLVNAPRGTLAEWSLKHHWLQKKLFGMYAQYEAMALTDMWHATCEKEYEEIRLAGYRQPVAIVPIGMDLPNFGSELMVKELKLDRGLKKVVFFGRLHKVKAIDNLVLAWAQLAEFFKGWELIVAGPDGGMRCELESLVDEKKIPRVSFVGELNGDAKYKFLSSAEIYVLPSLTENFGVTVAEALVCSTPVIASQGTPWRGLESEKAGKWIPVGVEPLVMALREIMALNDDARRHMGERGREWITRDFSWNGIGVKMKAAYEWLLGRYEKPEWVRVD